MGHLQLHAIFRGRVQGVGFRWTVVECAERFYVTGTVQNLPNGRVEVFAQGEKSALDAFLEAIQKDSGPACIESIDTEYNKPKTSYHGFRIV